MTDDDRPIERELSALLDGELTPDEESRVRAAVEADPVLARRLRELEEVDRALLALPARPVPADAKARLRARIATEAEDAQRRRPVTAARPASRRPRRIRRIATGAAMALAAGLLALLLLPMDSGDETVPEPTPMAERGPEPTPIAERVPEPPSIAEEMEDLPDLLAPEEPALDEDTLVLAGKLPESDLPVVEVLDWLEVLDELEAPEQSG